MVGNGEEPGKLPLLVLHGGPGASHDYLEPLEAMAKTGRRVIFYDQLGGGNSDHPHNPSMWTVELFVEELGAVRKALALDRLHILGQSWGGMLGMEYALEYQEAILVFYRRHVCRVDPWPECVRRTFEKLDQYPEVYHTMNGPSEFYVIGTLKTWDITDRLHEINVPTLLLSGRYDEATPIIVETIHRSIPGSEWIIFENSSHMPHVEETDRYLQVLDRFLTRVEGEISLQGRMQCIQ
jgi:pimeloyl-ACP methyl ester carboxylesterase